MPVPVKNCVHVRLLNRKFNQDYFWHIKENNKVLRPDFRWYRVVDCGMWKGANEAKIVLMKAATNNKGEGDG